MSATLRHPIAAARALKARAGRTVRRLRSATTLVFPGEAEFLRALGGRFGTVDEAIASFAAAGSALVPADLDDAAIAGFHAAHPETRAALVAAAGRVLAHRFDLLGSGPRDLGERLPWHVDFKHGHRFDRDAWYEDLRARVSAEFGSGRDVKVPWELSRFAHAPLLVQAWRVTGERAYLDELRVGIEDWIAENPIGRGVNWTCTMDVAIRAINWSWALALGGEAILADRRFAGRFLRALLAHGRFVAANLEKGSGATSNHYFSNLIGLMTLGSIFRGAPEGDEWRRFAAAEIEKENARQTWLDGADYEASTSYHRMMTEMALVGFLLIERGGGRAPGLRERVGRMAGYVAHYLKPDGLAPQIGDNDDGRILELGRHGNDRRDHRGALALAGGILDDPALYALGAAARDEVLWLVGPGVVNRLEARAGRLEVARTSAVFPQAGVAILRHEDLYVAIDAGPVGLDGEGAHAHNDTLSFELHAAGADLFVDPGTGDYTVDLARRDRFRATAGHNTVRVDGLEINPMPAAPFSLPGQDRPVIRRAVFRRTFDFVEAEHHGYERLADPVRHRRVLLLNRIARRLVIEDRLEGEAHHQVEWFFHLAPAAQAILAGDLLRLEGRAGAARFTLAATMAPPGVRAVLKDDQVSPGYGRVTPSRTLVFSWEGLLPIVARFEITVARPGPDAGGGAETTP